MPRYEPQHISASATITWRSHLLMTCISNSTVSSVAPEMTASSRAQRACQGIADKARSPPWTFTGSGKLRRKFAR
jgi:hypothetical protein